MPPDLGPEGPNGPAPGQFANHYTIYCNNDFVTVREITDAEFVDNIARTIAERLVREVPVGDIAVGLRPSTRGITGIPSLFWVEGYDGGTIRSSVTELGITVDVEVALDDVTWDFGDGTATSGAGLGEAWPAESSVRHVYQRSTDAAPYDVTATVTLGARWRFDGGAWDALDPLVRSATLPYEVHEIEAVRTR